MHRRLLAFLAAVVAVFAGGGAATGEVYGTFECAGVIADLPAGQTVGSIGEVRVYIEDGSSWKRVQNAVRVGFQNFYASSVFDLAPGTTYNFRVEFYNTSSALVDTQYTSGATRAEPAIPSTASELYVSPSGSDSGAGTIGDPYATVAHAFSVATAGTTINLRGGTYYQGEIYPPQDGTAANPIVLRSYNGEDAILDGADPGLISTTWTTVAPQVYRRAYTGDPRNVTLERKSDGEVFRVYMMGTASEVVTATSEGQSFDHWLIDAAYCADGANLTIRVPAGQISDYDVYVSARNTGIYLENRDFIYVDGITFTHYGHGSYSRAIYVYSSSDILVQNCTFLYNNVGVWVKNDSHRVTVQDSLCVDDTADWHFGYTKSMGVNYHGEVETGFVTCGGTYSGRGLVVRRNTITGLFDGAGLAPFAGYTGSRTAETEFYDNVIYHVADDFMEIDGYARNFRIYRNYMRISLSGISLAQALDGPTWIVRNVIADCGLVPATTVEGYESYPFKTNGGPSPDIGSGEVFFYHNTAYTLDPDSRAVLIKHAKWRKFTFRNNIWCGRARGFDSWETTLSPMDWDWDCLYTESGIYAQIGYPSTGTSYYTIGELRAGTGWLIHGIDQYPQFVDVNAGDYHLDAASPCIDAGVVLPGINEDYQGAAPDMGAYEYASQVDPEDTDSDGLPDDWEMEHFGDLDETAEGDYDGDGISNGEEYQGGTDPTVADTQAPVVTGVGTVPSQVREGADDYITVTALADDSSRGGSRIEAAEHFIGSDPGVGNGTPMAAADGAFDSPTEGLTGTVGVTSWSQGFYRVYVRAADAGGRWSMAESVLVPVVDGIAPGAVRNLTLSPALSFDELESLSWKSLGTVLAGTEQKTIDLGEPVEVGAVSLEVGRPAVLFPMQFEILSSENGVDWTSQARLSGFRSAAGEYLWLFPEGQVRYIRITAESRRDRSDGHYYVDIPGIKVFRTSAGNLVKAEWTATADDGLDAVSGPASVYDMRYSTNPITAANFDACDEAAGLPTPSARGTREEAVFSIGLLTGEIQAALKVGDEVVNWSDISNVATSYAGTVGLKPLWPEDAHSIGPGFPIQFTYLRSSDVRPAFIAFSDSSDFPQRPVRHPDGTVSMTRRFPLRTGLSYWKASIGQWRLVQRMAGLTGTVYWRLEGRHADYRGIYGPGRAIYFDTGQIGDTDASPSHENGGKTALWPTPDIVPSFSWTDATQGMEYFWVDISKDPSIPLKDRRSTIIVGTGRVTGPVIEVRTHEWRRIRKAASETGGVLYWRIRASDRYRTLSCASAVKEIVIDGGEFALGELDLASASPVATWTHTGEGLARFALEISVGPDFPRGPRYTVLVPPRGVEGDSYAFSEMDLRRLSLLAGRNSVATLYWRVRGETSDRQFVTSSQARTTPAPGL